MTDAEMMRFMAGCMLAEGPAPSVETPLHSLLPHRVIAHTHDVATMSLTNVRDATAERLVGELFEGRIVYVPYVRPGFPLAAGGGTKWRAGSRRDAIGLTLAHHGLVVWGDDAERVAPAAAPGGRQIDEYHRRQPAGPAPARRGPDPRARRRGAPASGGDHRARRAGACRCSAVRSALPDRVILHYDDSRRHPGDPRRGGHARAGRAGAWRRRSTSSAPGACRSGSTSTSPRRPTRSSARSASQIAAARAGVRGVPRAPRRARRAPARRLGQGRSSSPGSASSPPSATSAAP